MFKQLLLAVALIATPALSNAGLNSNPPFSKNTAQAESVVPTPAVNPCADAFSSAVKDDLTGRDDGKPSVILDEFFDETNQVMRAVGYCAPLEKPIGGSVTVDTVAQGLIDDLKAEAEKNGYKVTYATKKGSRVFGGSQSTRVAVICTPSKDKIEVAGIDFRVLTVFVFSNTRIVGLQMYVTAAGLKQP